MPRKLRIFDAGRGWPFRDRSKFVRVCPNAMLTLHGIKTNVLTKESTLARVELQPSLAKTT